MTKLIGLIGKIGSGKDTVASIIQDIRPEMCYENHKFAAVLKQMTATALGVTVERLEDRDYKNTPLPDIWQKDPSRIMTPRLFLQLIGTEFGRDMIHPDIWVNATFANFTTEDNWIMTDVRFPNEADRIKELGGVLVKIIGTEKHKLWVEAPHPSETALNSYAGIDFVIHNPKNSLEELRETVKVLLNSI